MRAGITFTPKGNPPAVPQLLAMGIVRVGTCGYSYRNWIGPVYPRGIASADMLPWYADRFSAVEIDSTYYRVLSSASFASMARRTPEDFRFTAKLPGTAMYAPLPKALEEIELFTRNITPLAEAGKFACALAQFPPSFKPGEHAERRLRALRDALGDLPLIAEFRDRQWQNTRTHALLRTINIGVVNVDEPPLPSLLHASSDVVGNIAYVRFHGRNAEQWHAGNHAERYNYRYTDEELQPWIAHITDMLACPQAPDAFVFFNNCHAEKAVSNAKAFEEMLESALPPGSVRRAIPLAPELPLK